MSASKLDTSGVFQPITVETQEIKLSLNPESVCIRKNGIEFRSLKSFPIWTEMTVDLLPPNQIKKVHCTGVVVACDGNRHTGYSVSMLFTGMSRQSQERLNSLAFSQLA